MPAPVFLERRVGINRNQRTGSLLKQIGGRIIKSSAADSGDSGLSSKQNLQPHLTQTAGPGTGGSSRTAHRNPLLHTNMNGTVKLEDPDLINAKPISSDDEQENLPATRSHFPKDPLDSDDDEEDDRHTSRADIRSTLFNKTRSSQRIIQSPSRGCDQPLSQTRKIPSGSQTTELSSSSGSKRSSQDAQLEMGIHLKDDKGFIKGSKKVKATYGAKSSQPRSSQTRSSQQKRTQVKSSQRAEPRSSAPNNFDGTSPKRFVPPDDSSPEKHQSPMKSRFRNPLDSDSENGSPAKPKFITSMPDSPLFSPVRPRMQIASTDLDSDNDGTPVARGIKKESRPIDIEKSKRKPTKRIRAPKKALTPFSAQEISQKPKFKIPGLADEDLNTLTDSDIQDIHGLDVTELDAVEGGDDDDRASPTRCPMCREEVDRELLEKHSDHGRMNIKRQAAFCRLHKRKKALSSGTEKGYPKIDWSSLDERCEDHVGFLREILEGTRQSHYGRKLEEKVQSGKNRTLLKTHESLTPGYYGPRGLRAMTDFIMRSLSSVVRKRAVEDRLISARGYTGYVQAVLVPELAVRLIMQDMMASEEDAREIMRDSVDVGELLHEDSGDIVTNRSDDEEDFRKVTRSPLLKTAESFTT